MDLRRKGLLLIAKMALQDGVVAPEELQTLEDMSGGFTSQELEAIIEEAKSRTLDELLSGIDKYEDRFVIALRAFHMAHSDRSYDIEEELNFELLITRFGISAEDRGLIERVQGGMSGESPVAPEPRLLALHRGSSFFSGEG